MFNGGWFNVLRRLILRRPKNPDGGIVITPPPAPVFAKMDFGKRPNSSLMLFF